MPARSNTNTTGRPWSPKAWSKARAKEGGVNGHDRAQTAHGHPGAHRHRVLLGYAHVEEPVGEAGL
jgi:hypothetical protein